MPESPATSDLQQHREWLEAFTEKLLRPYLNRLQSKNAPAAPKVFNDPVWGSMVLTPLEIILIDSLLVQRLRRVRQLGVVHWVYPGATHTRF